MLLAELKEKLIDACEEYIHQAKDRIMATEEVWETLEKLTTKYDEE